LARLRPVAEGDFVSGFIKGALKFAPGLAHSRGHRGSLRAGVSKELPVDGAQDLAEGDLNRRPQEKIAAVLSALAANDRAD